MHAQMTPLDGSKAIGITFTDKPVTAFGGLALFVAFAERLGLAGKLAEALPFVLTSPNAMPPHQVVLAFLAGMLAGARSFAHLAVLQVDEPVRRLLGLRRFPSPATVTRFFRRLTTKTITETFEPLFAWCLERLPARPEGYNLDLDSRVCERYGQQEGALKGYIPKKDGRPSPHPLFAVLAEARTIAHVWLRSGNTSSARGAVAFLAEVQALVAHRVRVALVRADSGFFDEAILAALEAASLPYAIAARFLKPLQVEVRGLTYRRFAPGLEVAECVFKAQPWSRARRVIIMREELTARPEARGRLLLTVPGSRVHAVVTPLTLPAEEVWRTYNGRADSENRIKELTHAFGSDGFCSQRVASTEAALRFICLLSNLVAEFQRSLGSTGNRTLTTLRTTLFACGAILGTRGRQALLRLSRAKPWQARFLNALQRLVGDPSNGNAIAIGEVTS